MDENQGTPAPRPRLIGPSEMFAAAGACFVITGVGLIHFPSAVIVAGLVQWAVAVALARV